jgi:hypothetical protein
MPRLPPQWDGKPAVIELRQTKGTYERHIEKERLQIEKINAYSNVVRNSILPIGILGASVGVGLAGYFVARGLTSIGQGILGNPIQDIKDTADQVLEGSRGLNQDGSYQTWLCIEGGVAGLGVASVNQVVVFSDWSGWYGIGGIAGAFSKFVATQLTAGVWLEVFGNFNKDAKHVSQLSEGWYVNENYTPPTGDEFAEYGENPEGETIDASDGELWYTEDGIAMIGSYRYDDLYDTEGTYESAWSVNGWTKEEWQEMGSPITQEWIDYMKSYPNRFDEDTIAYFERLKEYQENYWSEENPAPVGVDTSSDVFNYDHDNDGIPNWEDEDYEG